MFRRSMPESRPCTTITPAFCSMAPEPGLPSSRCGWLRRCRRSHPYSDGTRNNSHWNAYNRRKWNRGKSEGSRQRSSLHLPLGQGLRLPLPLLNRKMAIEGIEGRRKDCRVHAYETLNRGVLQAIFLTFNRVGSRLGTPGFRRTLDIPSWFWLLKISPSGPGSGFSTGTATEGTYSTTQSFD